MCYSKLLRWACILTAIFCLTSDGLGIETVLADSPDDLLTITLSVSDKTDDTVEQLSTGRNRVSFVHAYPGRNSLIGYRFRNVPIPRGAEIQSSVLYQYCSGYEDREISLLYTGEASADALPFHGDSFNLSTRNRTPAGVVEAPSPWKKYAFNPSPDLRAIIQEIVDLPGWVQGNALTLMVEDQNSNSIRKTDHYEYSPSNAAKLEVNYRISDGVDTDSIPPVVSITNPGQDTETPYPELNISGTATDNMGVKNVSWATNRGEAGEAAGTGEWSIVGVPLHDGLNKITITAVDDAGNEGALILSVRMIPPEQGSPDVVVSVVSAEDDSFEKIYNGTTNPSSNVVHVGLGRTAGFRFSSVPIPVGSVIISAVLKLHCLANGDGGVVLEYSGESSLASQPFTRSLYDLSSRSRTSARVLDQPSVWGEGTYNPGPDLKDIVQQIVDSPGWTQGAPLTLLITDAGSTSIRSVTAFENDSYSTAVLEIQYVPLEKGVVARAEPLMVQVGQPVSFVAISADPDSTASYFWSFGDGDVANTADPVHKYDTDGTFTVLLEAQDLKGSLYYDELEINVVAPNKFEGFGRETTGGEGYPVHTARSASELYSILTQVRAAGGNATIRLEGSWTYTSDIALTHLQNLTVNGMNADVIIDNASIYLIDCTNIILQGLRVRNHQSGGDSIGINSCRNVVVDHCSVSEAGDGNIDITGYSYGASRDVTVSWSILANTWKQSLIKYNGTTGITFHHNLIYNSGGRLPSMHEGIFDIRNNVIWQWGSYGTFLASGAQANIVNNVYRIAPGSTRGHAAIWYYDLESGAWIEGNILPPRETDVSRLSGPLEVPPVDTQTASEAKSLVLEQAGAVPRDNYDLEIISNVQSEAFPPLPPVHD